MEKLWRENPELMKAEEEFFSSWGAKKPKTGRHVYILDPGD